MTDLLVRDPKPGRALAQSLGDKPVALMRGHGNVTVGSSIPYAVYHRAQPVRERLAWS